MRYALKIQWHFFASGHGKGVVDGIGATVKGTVWRRIIAGKLVKTAKDVADTPEQYCPGVHIMYVPAEDILECSGPPRTLARSQDDPQHLAIALLQLDCSLRRRSTRGVWRRLPKNDVSS